MDFRTIDVHRDVAGFRNFTSIFMSSVRCQGRWWQVHEGNIRTMNTARGEHSELFEGETESATEKHRKYMKTVAAY